MDIIFVTDIRIETIIGIHDWERRVKQAVVLDLEIATDCARAAASDTVSDTVDYKALTKRLVEFVGESEFKLVETLAERCAELLIAEFDVPWVRLRLNKQGALRDARDVGVVIERGRRG